MFLLCFSYFIVDILQLFFQHCHVVSQGIPLLLQLTQVCLETNALMVHKLKSFVQCLHLQRRKKAFNLCTFELIRNSAEREGQTHHVFSFVQLVPEALSLPVHAPPLL